MTGIRHDVVMMEISRYYRAVRQFVLTEPEWSADRIVYQTLPDERYDITLVALRVYGNREDYIAVMASAGMDRLDQELTERLLVLPSRERLDMMKRQTGYRMTGV